MRGLSERHRLRVPSANGLNATSTEGETLARCFVPGSSNILSAMLRTAARLGSFFVAVLPAFVSLSAAAQDTTLVVLGIRSVEGDEDLARDLTDALRQVAAEVPGITVSEAQVTLSQMSMVHGCDEPNVTCMTAIAADLQQQRVLYGTLRRTGGGAESDFALTLYYFNAETSQIEASLTDTIPRGQTDLDALRPAASRYVGRFTNQTRYGSARVTTNVPGAAVIVDGNPVGTTNEAGAIEIPDLTEGEHELEISADGYDAYEGSFRVVADERTDFRASLAVDYGMNLAWVPGATLLAGGAVLFGFGMRSWGRGRRYNRQAQNLKRRSAGDIRNLISQLSANIELDGITPYQHAMLATEAGSSACTSKFRDFERFDDSLRERVRNACDDRNRHYVLQFVFNLTAGALAVAGASWIAVALLGQDDEEAETATLRNFRLVPSVGRRDLGMHFGFDF